MSSVIPHRNIKPRDREGLEWYASLEVELQKIICRAGNGVTMRANKGCTCFVGADRRPVGEIVCVGKEPNRVVFGVAKERADAPGCSLRELPWDKTFRVMPANKTDALFYEVRLPDDPSDRLLRIRKILAACKLDSSEEDALGAAIDAL